MKICALENSSERGEKAFGDPHLFLVSVKSHLEYKQPEPNSNPSMNSMARLLMALKVKVSIQNKGKEENNTWEVE